MEEERSQYGWGQLDFREEQTFEWLLLDKWEFCCGKMCMQTMNLGMQGRVKKCDVWGKLLQSAVHGAEQQDKRLKDSESPSLDRPSALGQWVPDCI